MSGAEETILRQAAQTGMPVPASIQNAPDLAHGLDLFLLAFHALSSSRKIGMMPGPIPTIEMILYARLQGLEKEQEEDLVWIVSRLDHLYLEWLRKRSEANSGKRH
jgi:hypothetical protein